jgi:FkbM family methyltransferase
MEPRNLPSHRMTPFQRRSGIACSLICDVIDFVPDSIYVVGCGAKAPEVAVFYDAWPDCLVVGFEPNPKNYNWIKDKFSKGELYQTAVGNRIGTATLYEKSKHPDGSSLYKFDDPSIQETTTSYEVPISTLDALVPKGPPTEHTLLWLDCEGAELDVLKGAEKFMEKVSVINYESTARPYSKSWDSQKEVHDYLMARGWKRQWLAAQRISRGQTDAFLVRPHLFRPEYTCCPCQIDGSCENK